MPQIALKDVVKVYRVSKRGRGLMGAVKGAFSREQELVRAVDGISFSLEAGEMVGYIGPNGAGKSTTVKLMSGILVPDGGEISIMGLCPHKERRAHVARIGVVFGQKSQLWWDTPVSDSFDLLRDIYRIPADIYGKWSAELIERLDAGGFLRTPVRQLSLGQRMRCELIASLLHQPDILFLDEPTIGLDAVSKLSLRSFLTELNRDRGVTMILTTHDMDDIEALCSRVMVIGRGALLFDGNIDTLRQRYAPWRIMKVRMSADVEALNIPQADSATVNGLNARITFMPDVIAAESIISAVAGQVGIADLTVEAPDIEEIVAGMYREMSL